MGYITGNSRGAGKTEILWRLVAIRGLLVGPDRADNLRPKANGDGFMVSWKLYDISAMRFGCGDCEDEAGVQIVASTKFGASGWI